MSFFGKLFGGEKKIGPTTTEDFVDLLTPHFCGIRYSLEYQNILEHAFDKKAAIAELLLFRAWATQFGFRLFCKNKSLSERVVFEIVNQTKVIGQELLRSVFEVNIGSIYPHGFMTTLQLRWEEYDEIYIRNANSHDPIVADLLCEELMVHCLFVDRSTLPLLVEKYIRQLGVIKMEADRLNSLQ